MKIAMFGHKVIPSRSGGIEVAVGHLCARMAELGHDVTCFNRAESGMKPEETCWKGVRIKTVLTVNRKGLAAVTSSFFAALLAAHSDADVVHIHALGPAFWCWIPAMAGKKVVVTVHGLDWKREKWKGSIGAAFIRGGEKMAVRFAHEMIVLSTDAQRYYRDTWGRETVLIPNGVTLPENRNVKLPDHLGLCEDGYILFLGRLVPEKGVHHLIEAFRRVRTDRKLVIAGAGSDTADYEKRLKEMARGDDRILFTGFVQGDTLDALYRSALVYVLPSELEGMPLSLLEAMSWGNCCVVSDLPECADVLDGCGMVFPRGNVRELEACLQKLCDDPELVSRCRTETLEAIRRKPGWSEVTERTLEVYR